MAIHQNNCVTKMKWKLSKSTCGGNQNQQKSFVGGNQNRMVALC